MDSSIIKHKLINIKNKTTIAKKIVNKTTNNKKPQIYNADKTVDVSTIYSMDKTTNDKTTNDVKNTPILHKISEPADMSWDDLFSQLNDPIQTNIINIYHEHRQDNLDESQTPENIKNRYQNLEAVISVVDGNRESCCESCSGIQQIFNNVLICTVCGLETKQLAISFDDTTTSVVNDSNVNDKGYMSMRVTGKGSYGYNRNLLKSCANYSQYRKINTLKEMHNWNAQSTGMKLPKNVMDEANNMFAKIKEKGYVYRKDVKKGVQSACLYYACYNNGISKTPNEIAQIAQIAEKFHSAGDRILRDLNERGIIDLPNKINPIIDYVERYFELLGIPKKYKDFVLDIIERADRDKLHVLCDSKNNTKCIGAIYMLIDRVPELRKAIDKDKIDKECEISKTTFIKYFSLLCKYYRKFVPIFAKHKIPMKSAWREDINSVIKQSKESDNEDYVSKRINRKVRVWNKPLLRSTRKIRVKIDTGSEDESVNKLSDLEEEGEMINSKISIKVSDSKETVNYKEITNSTEAENNTDINSNKISSLIMNNRKSEFTTDKSLIMEKSNKSPKKSDKKIVKKKIISKNIEELTTPIKKNNKQFLLDRMYESIKRNRISS